MATDPKKAKPKTSVLALIFLGIVRFYQLVISPLLGPRCRFQPTCSSYAIEAIKLHGGLKGGWLAAKRIARCHPWGGFGYDPVPQSDHANTGQTCNCERATEKHATKVSLKAGKSQRQSGCDTDG